MPSKRDWMCARCGKLNIAAYHKCVLCRRPQNAPKGWSMPQHDDAGAQAWSYSE